MMKWNVYFILLSRICWIGVDGLWSSVSNTNCYIGESCSYYIDIYKRTTAGSVGTYRGIEFVHYENSNSNKYTVLGKVYFSPRHIVRIPLDVEHREKYKNRLRGTAQTTTSYWRFKLNVNPVTRNDSGKHEIRYLFTAKGKIIPTQRTASVRNWIVQERPNVTTASPTSTTKTSSTMSTVIGGVVGGVIAATFIVYILYVVFCKKSRRRTVVVETQAPRNETNNILVIMKKETVDATPAVVPQPQAAYQPQYPPQPYLPQAGPYPQKAYPYPPQAAPYPPHFASYPPQAGPYPTTASYPPQQGTMDQLQPPSYAP